VRPLRADPPRHPARAITAEMDEPPSISTDFKVKVYNLLAVTVWMPGLKGRERCHVSRW
jgi:hypothetical protein